MIKEEGLCLYSGLTAKNGTCILYNNMSERTVICFEAMNIALVVLRHYTIIQKVSAAQHIND